MLAQAQHNLGVMYDKGQGVYVKTHKWFNIAGLSENKISRRNANILKGKMTPGKIVFAVGLARKWIEKL